MIRTESSGMIRHGFGIKALDQNLHGGIPQGSMVLGVGPPGSGKSTLGKQLLLSTVNAGKPAILLSTGEPDQIILDSVKNLGMDFRGVEKIRLIDCFSWRAGFRNVPDLRKLDEVTTALDNLLSILRSTSGAVLVVDSLTDFLLNNPEGSVVNFLSQLKPLLQVREVTTLLEMERGPHDPKLESTIEFLADGTIETKLDGSTRHMSIKRMLATPVQPRWVAFTIDKTVDAVLKEFFGSKEL